MRKNRIYTMTHSRYLLLAFDGTEKFKEYWNNFVYNYFDNDPHLRITHVWAVDHFQIVKAKFEPMLKLAVQIQLQLKHRDKTEEEIEERTNKILDFYLNRVIINVKSNKHLI